MNTRVLTGITTSGTPHLGNYAGAIRPSIRASAQAGVDAFYFMADYHALIKCDDPQRIARSRLEIAATWIAAGLDTDKVTFYRQSDIPEIPELCWMLTCVTPKGLMNRAHAYKASVDQNQLKQLDPDDGITMGLFSYPVLMAADILMFNANKVPVGRDQIQHLEMTRDIAQRFNHLYGRGKDYFVLPEVQIEEEVATLPGLDGRKMSKSYDNTIPLFEGGAGAMRAAVMRIVTDSRQPGQPKDAEGSHLYTLYRAFATHEESARFRLDLEQGLGWGEAKELLYKRIEQDLAPMRAQYAELMARPDRIEDILQAGAVKARKLSSVFMSQLREAVGLRQPAQVAASNIVKQKTGGKRARFVSFRDETGQFRFRLLGADASELLQSEPFTHPQAAGQAIQSLRSAVLDDILVEHDGVATFNVAGQVVGRCPVSSLPQLRIALREMEEDQGVK
ncbi:tryptophan--tRNA ligase [Paralcaligenes ureilyticus]|uniref:Tryptophan--tRNA ligase n=1 Tax=Paralcaligenes ureilyticus TaxID=627131 RepID=A0A4R3LSQ4_9BURK|nr:tryptophan--tRNA ligase [Paralcaligenes ureilyticus]TCT03381.1 tryptophanyl-tRNA synthetase [Paralcaligenes ureilyticus]